MSDVDPLIRRELQWMALSSLEDKDLAAIIIAKSRRRKLRRWASKIVFALAVSVISIQGYIAISNLSNSETTASQPSENSSVEITEDPATPSQNTSPSGAQITGVISDYPLTWEESVGDLGAISKAAGIGDTLGGLTAQGLFVNWTKCAVGVCPTTWRLSATNKTGDIIFVAPSLMVYVDNAPLVSASRPLSVVPGGKVNLVFSFPEIKDLTNVGNKATWQWNWFLTVAR
ncbi:MAG: hypothetical protein RI899_269 [Actinomycetota bacterium]